MEAVKSLTLPSCYVEVTDNEMEYLDGKGLFSKICKWVGAVVATAGVVTMVVGAILAFTPAAPAAAPVVAKGALCYMGGMYILAMGGLIDVKDVEFPSIENM